MSMELCDLIAEADSPPGMLCWSFCRTALFSMLRLCTAKMGCECIEQSLQIDSNGLIELDDCVSALTSISLH